MFTIDSNHNSELDQALEDASLTGQKPKIHLISRQKCTDYTVLKLAALHKLSVELSNGENYGNKKAATINKLVNLINLSRTRFERSEAKELLCNAVVKCWQVDFFASDYEELLGRLPLDVTDAIEKKVQERESEISSFHSLAKSSERVRSYADSFERILDSKNKLVVLNGGMGTFKTTSLRSIYTHYRKKEMFPILLTAKRTIAGNFFSEDHEDHYFSGSSKRKGLIGVINTLAQNKHKEDREHSRVLLIDEIQDLFNHISTGSLGRTFGDRVRVNNIVNKLIQSVDKVVVADAMITQKTLDWLEDLIGSPALILTAGTPVELKVQITTENQLIGAAKKDLELGKKVALFCDYRGEKFSEIYNSFASDPNINAIAVNAKYFDGVRVDSQSIERVLKESDFAIISPVINSGVSIELRDYERVYVLAGQTLSPTACLQSIRRFRCAKEAVVAFRAGFGSKRITEAYPYILRCVIWDEHDPVRAAERYFDNPSARFLAEHAAHANQQFRDFRQTFAIAARQMGFELYSQRLNPDVRKAGSQARRRGRRTNEQIRQEAAFEIAGLVSQGQTFEIDFGGDVKTFEQEVALRTYRAMDLLAIPVLDEHTYLEIFEFDIDQIVRNRRLLNAAASKSFSDFTVRQQLAASQAFKFLKDSGWDESDECKNLITKSKVESAFEGLKSEVVLETGNSVCGLELVSAAFQDVNFSKRYRTQVFRDLVRELGFDLEKAGHIGREAAYRVVRLVKTWRGERVDLTGLADRYEPFPPVQSSERGKVKMAGRFLAA